MVKFLKFKYLNRVVQMKMKIQDNFKAEEVGVEEEVEEEEMEV